MEKFNFRKFWDLVKNDPTVLAAWNQVTDQLLNLPSDQDKVRRLMEKTSDQYEYVRLTIELWCSRRKEAKVKDLVKYFEDLHFINIAQKIALLDSLDEFECQEGIFLTHREIEETPGAASKNLNEELETEAEKVLLGIDLGTTYSCVGIWRNGKVEVLAIVPSCVSFRGGRTIVGHEAKFNGNPANTISEIKRLMGRSYTDPDIQSDFQRWPFKIVPSDGWPLVRVRINDAYKDFRPEDISSLILLEMKKIAESVVGHNVKSAVITVPANFNNAQREATKIAAELAGLDLIQIVNEPTAAALAYGLDKKENPDGSEIIGRNILVYDLGGGTFDVTILSIDVNVMMSDEVTTASYFDVLATGGDTHLGGEDFDTRLANRFQNEFEKEHNVDLSNDQEAMVRLREAAERAKCTLSSELEATVSIKALQKDKDFNIKITRREFEHLCADLFAATIEIIEKVLQPMPMDKTKVQEVVMIGGSTRIPRIYELLKEYFDNDVVVINKSINPDEAVARGATLLAATLVPSPVPLLDVCLTDVIPSSLGVAVKVNKSTSQHMFTVVKRFTQIPASASQEFTTFFDNQTRVEIAIYEGESPTVDDNNKLGSFLLHGIKKAPKGEPKINVKMEVDGCGILNVSATEKRSGVSESISIERVGTVFGKASVKPMPDGDRGLSSNTEKPSAKVQIEDSARNLKRYCREENCPLRNPNYLIKLFDGVLEWLETNTNSTNREFEERLWEFRREANLPKSLELPFIF